MTGPTIQLANVSKRFGAVQALSKRCPSAVQALSKRCPSAVQALDNVSLEIHPGGVYAVLGENGAGKTTAIRLLLGLELADEGAASVLGLDSAKEGREIHRRVGYVPEQPALYQWMTVEEIGWFTEGFYGEGYLASYRELTGKFRLSAKAKIKSLSRGMRSKVALSLALAHDPDVLILDEPTSGLDALVRREFLESMVEWAAGDRTVLLCSHQINEVERVADTVAMVRDGRVLLIEKLDALKMNSRQVIVTLNSDSSVEPLPWPVVDKRCSGRQWQFIVSDWDESRLDELAQRPDVSAVETHASSLEELFVAYMSGDPLRSSEQSVERTSGQSASTQQEPAS